MQETIESTEVGSRTARRAYVTGSVGFIVIGVLHTVVHLLELRGPVLEERFLTMGTIAVSGQHPEAWDLFQGISLLMGLFSLTVGLVDLGALHAAGSDATPPVPVAVTNMMMLAAITAIGVAHLGLLQIVGGIAGFCLFGITVVRAGSSRWFAHRLSAH